MKTLERLLWTLGGAIAGYYTGNAFGKTEEEKRKFALKGVVIGGSSFLGLTFWESNDTVNYTLYHKKKRVYDGICKANRIGRRMLEHKVDGKIFDDWNCNSPRPRSESADLERYRIRRFQPKYNIHHNF